MGKSLKFRVKEWLADRSPRFQYPVQRVQRDAEFSRARIGWEHPMPFSTRVFVLSMSIVAIIIAVPALIVSGVFLFWVIKTIL